MVEMKHLVQRMKHDLEDALSYRVDYEHVNNVFSFRSFEYTYNVRERTLISGQSWVQKLVLKRVKDFTPADERLLNDSTVVIALFYDKDDEPVPVMKQNLVHVLYKDEYLGSDYKAVKKQILHVLPVDSVNLVDDVDKEDSLNSLIAWMEYEESNFKSYSGRNKLLEYYPHSELLRP